MKPNIMETGNIQKSVGVIGGFGPETTAEFYLAVNFGCQQIAKDRRPLIVISNCPLPFEIERDLITFNTGQERYIPFLTAEAKRLEASGVDFLVLPCNSLHVFIDDIRSAVKIPVLSIVEETCDYIQKNNFHKISLISTSATVKNRLYETEFEHRGINFLVPDGLQRAEMDKIIQRLVNGEHLNRDREKILEVVQSLKLKKVDAVALACTDLQLLLPDDDEVPIFDTMKVLADSTVRELVRKNE
jgi:aspartate racemase